MCAYKSMCTYEVEYGRYPDIQIDTQLCYLQEMFCILNLVMYVLDYPSVSGYAYHYTWANFPYIL